MTTHVIGTAGHVDHGKSSLVNALTGINPDRLKEEQEREMTIELGFAWCKLPSGEDVGIVDVPGHRDFIENMLAGVGGIDAVLLVIAIDEGIMPQTREHLAIIDLLKVQNGVVVLTKIDLIPDPDWQAMVEEDVRKALQNSCLSNAPVVRVSSKTGQGIPELMREISNVLDNCPSRTDIGQPRLPVDRVFSLPGFGTIVTGTLSNGSFHLGDEVIVLPSGSLSRIRGLQNHKHKVNHVLPGQRVAINLPGLAVDDVKRGEVITLPGLYPPTRRVDVSFDLLKDVSANLSHRDQVKMFTGATEVQGSVRLLGVEQLQPGHRAFLQIELDSPIAAQKGDRFILRRPSPGETLGGGSIIEINSIKRYKRFSDEIITMLEKKESGTVTDRILAIVQSESPVLITDLIKRIGIDPQPILQEVKLLIEQGTVIQLRVSESDHQNHIVSIGYLNQLEKTILALLENYHKTNPLKVGISREELRSRLKLQPKIYNGLVDVIAQKKTIEGSQTHIWLSGYSVMLNPHQQLQTEKLLDRFHADPLQPPSVKEALEMVGDDVFRVLLERGEIILLNEDVAFDSNTFNKVKTEVVQYLQKNGNITVGDFRDRFQTSRKYSLAFLEYLDKINITRRNGDFRQLIRSTGG